MPDAVKAARYIQLLDDARCDEGWDQVPELVRKVRKHAPNRICLTLTAETEHALATGSQGPTPHSDGQDATALPKLSIEPAVQAPKLLDAIQNEEQHPEERFQGLVCLGWLHWVAKDYDQARLRLPRNFNEEYPQFSTLEKLSEWTKVCALKSAYLKANCLMRYDQRDEALQSLDASLPSLSAVWATRNARQALKYWAELVLTECCMLSSQALSVQQKSLEDANCLTCFRAWSKYWATQQVPFVGGHGFKGSVSRRQVWAEYYTVISQILQDDLAFPTGYAQVNSESSARSQLRAEVKKVDVIYSGLLFSETKFPRADEDRREVEDYVERLMQNWAVLAGRGWREQDLGPGGRESLSRGVLDSLYGAAMKTFHSTAILRHLFIVHLSVAEFDLAFKSFDSYLELVTKAKARMEKTGQPEPSLDDDAIVLQTISACISTLCRYGGREAAEKAKHLASDLEKWLAKLGQSVSGHEDAINSLREDGPVTSYPSIPPNVYALSWQSIGLAQAQWARMTYEPEVRAQLQERAIQCLRRSLYPEFGNAVDIRGVFALGLLYAEQRKLSTAIELIKTALLADSTPDVYQDLYNGPYWRERALIPLWHLLALMLSAREEFFLAARACEGAVEQFRDPYVLFGGRHLGGGYRSEHLAEAEAEEEDADGLVDDMDEYEREGLLEVKMTQLAILEVVEGPAVAVNASRELLSLFPRLFSDAEQRAAGIKGIQPPSTSSGGATSRGFRQSVFGGAKSIRSAKSSVAAARRSVINNELIPPTPQLPREASPAAPSIQVTGDKAGANRRSKKAESLQRRSRRDSSASRLRAHSAGGGPRDSESFFAPIQDLETPQSFNVAGKDVARTQSQASSMYSQSMAGRTSRQPSIASASVADMAVISMNEFETFAAFLPSVVFPEAHGKRRRRALLMRVWLLIAGFYRRAGLFANSQEACAEALRIVQGLEADMVKDETGSLSVRHAAWGEQKSMQELLADVWAEQAHLSLARGEAFQAMHEFEAALIHFPDHPSAIVGLSELLLDMYTEKLLPAPAKPNLVSPGGLSAPPDVNAGVAHATANLGISTRSDNKAALALPNTPLGLVNTPSDGKETQTHNDSATTTLEENSVRLNGTAPATTTTPSAASPPRLPATERGAASTLPPPHRAHSLPLNDRLAARDRAHGLLSGLTKLGSGWNRAGAWFALARALEASGQPDKAKEALWWCVELEDGAGVREWGSVGGGGYVM